MVGNPQKAPFREAEVRERRFQMCTLKEKGIGLHGAAPRGILLGYWQVYTHQDREILYLAISGSRRGPPLQLKGVHAILPSVLGPAVLYT